MTEKHRKLLATPQQIREEVRLSNPDLKYWVVLSLPRPSTGEDQGRALIWRFNFPPPCTHPDLGGNAGFDELSNSTATSDDREAPETSCDAPADPRGGAANP